MAKAIDDDPWRCAIRATIDSANRQEILKLLENGEQISNQPTRALYMLGHLLNQQQFNYHNSNRAYSPISLVMLKRAWQLSPSDFQICWTLSKHCPDEMDAHSFAMAAVAAAPESEFAKKWSTTAEDSAESEPILSVFELVKKGDKAPEWKFPHMVIESSLGEKVFIGPTRYPTLTDKEKKNLDREVQELRWSIRLQPTVIALYLQLAKRLVRMGRFDEALVTYEATTKLKGKLDPWETIAEELYGMGQIDKAKELLEAMTRQGETRWLNEVYALLGVIHNEQGQQAKAFECFQKAYIRIYHPEGDDIGFMSTTVPVWGWVMRCFGTTEQVMAAYHEWIAHASSLGASLSIELGEYLIKHGKLEEALAVYREALTRNDGDKVLYNLSRLLVQMKRPDEAIAVYTDAIAKKPLDIDLRQERAKLYGEIGKSAERVAELNLIVSLYLEKIKTETKGSDFHGSLADVYRSLGKNEEASKHYREYIQSSGNAPQLNNFAMNYALNFDPIDRDGELAVEAATRACELTGYGDSNVLDTLATAYAEKGEFDAAVKWQLKAIEILDDEQKREELENNLKRFREKRTVPPRSKVPND